MKNESRIEELLAESLLKQDRLAEQVGTMAKSIDNLTSAMVDLKEIATSQLKVQQGYVGALREVRNDLNERVDQIENKSDT